MVSFTSSAVLIVAAASTLVANAQVNCVYASWASNGDNQNPCEVWQKLGQICSSSFTVSPLQASTSTNGTSPGYPPPSAGQTTPNDACQCNHIAYSLMAACSWCQDGIYSDSWVTESDWSSGCQNYVADGVASSVNATGINIPPYALEAIPGPVWDPTDAQAAQVRLGSSGTTSGSNQHSGSIASASVKIASALLIVPVTLSMFL